MAEGAEPSATPPAKQGAALLKTDLMGVFAHPDDETGSSTALAAYALGRGKNVVNVYCTRGEGGGNMVGTQWGAALGILREVELKDALARIGLREVFFLDREDFFYTESVAATWRKWGKEETLGRLVRFIRALRPEVIVTMNPAPTPGQHGHHQAAAVLATEAFDAAADPNRFPDQIRKEGLTVWQARKLYYGGGGPGDVASIEVNEVLPGGETPARLAGAAAANHRSQAFGDFGNSPRARRPQKFHLVKSVVPFVTEESDLFRGLPVADAEAKPVHAAGSSQGSGPLSMEFVPRTAIALYRQWAREQGIETVVEALPSDLSLVAGEETEIELRIHNASAEASEAEVAFSLPAGWRVSPARIKHRTPANATDTVRCNVTAPVGSLTEAELKAIAVGGTTNVASSIRLHPVPRIEMARAAKVPELSANGAGWEGIPAQIIPPTHLVQGKVRDASDSSGAFRVTYDAQKLYVDVEVTDDVVVTNIAPDDIRGHWRTDSVEICIDPVGGAESTVDCFKLGIFPFDTTGVVRAERDADANQGLIEETAPGTRVSSRRTPGGYRIEAAIPFREIGIQPVEGKRLGFNIIIYDGDKTNAVAGENINKSRIAWAPRSGVQGRPEDWGRIDLRP